MFIILSAGADGCRKHEAGSVAEAVRGWPAAEGLRLFQGSARSRHIEARRVTMGEMSRQSYVLFPGQAIEDKLEPAGGLLVFEAGGVGFPEQGPEKKLMLRVEAQAGEAVSGSTVLIKIGSWIPVRMKMPEAQGEGAKSLTIRVSFPSGDDASAVAVAAPRIVKESPGRPSVIIISIDTLRADHLACYGYGRNVSPNIDKLAKESVVFADCSSQSSWTPTSVGSLFTSLYPSQHGSFGRDRIPLPGEDVTLAEALRDAGYYTAAFSASPFIHPDFGFGQGFMEFGFDPSENAGKLNSLVLGWLKERAQEPTFLYVMYFDPHFKYSPPPPFAEMFRDGPDHKPLWDPGHVTRIDNLFDLNATVGRETFEFLKSEYDGEIAYTDSELGRLLEALRAAGMLDNSILVFTADHGEEFLEHGGFGHGNTLYREVLHVPLMIRAPGIASPAPARTPVRQIDVMPTILQILGIALPRPVEGKSLAPLLKSPEDVDERPVYAATRHLLREEEVMRSLVKGDFKIIVAENPARVELYDLSSDPEEQENLTQSRPELRKEMTGELIRFEAAMLPSYQGTSAAPPPDRTVELLKSLGYLGK